jgi:anaerobic selenocysteine-containing dehydrogenase
MPKSNGHPGEWRWEEDGLTVTRTIGWSGPGCHSQCGLLVYSQGNRVLKVEGDPETPYSEGRLCLRCLALPKVVHHPDRLTYPLKRVGERGEGKWERISWEAAYTLIEEKTRQIKTQFGPESIVVMMGTGRNVWYLGSRLGYTGFGTPNICMFFSGLSCYAPRLRVMPITQGFFCVADAAQMFPDRFDNPAWKVPQCILIWGNNPVVSNPDSFMGWWLVECLKRGSKLIVVDPRRTWLANKAEVWLQVRPGTDAALALAMINVIIEENLYDREFVEKWTSGFDELKERARQYSPEKVEKITWIPQEKIIAAARLYARSKPAAIQWGVGFEQANSGVSSILAIQALWGLTGNLDVPGGNIINKPTPFHEIPPPLWGRREMPSEIKKKRIGAKEFPLVPMAQPDVLVETMLTGKPYPIKMAWIESTNPIACMGADSKKTLRALQAMDFVVVADLFMTPTAMAAADLVLPVASALERDGLRSEDYETAWWGPLRTVNKVVQIGECKSDEEITLELGRRLNPEGFPWQNVEEMLDWVVRDSGMTFKELRALGPPRYHPFEYRKFEKGLLRADGKPGFETDTGKFLFSVPYFKTIGLDSLPYYEEPPESPVSTPDLAREYPLILTTGARSWAFFNSEQRQVPELREVHPDPITEIHPATAQKYGIQDGDWIWIENMRGKCQQKARLTATIDERVVHAQHGWWYPEKPGPAPSYFGVWESNINLLVPFGQQGPSGFCAPYRCGICRIAKVQEELK